MNYLVSQIVNFITEQEEVINVKSLKKLLAEMIQKIAKHTAILACGAASAYGGYQTKEPKNIYKR